MVALLLAIQLALSCLRGHDLMLGSAHPSTDPASIAEIIALHEHDELDERGIHQHDDLPPHLHVPEDDFLRRGAGKSIDLAMDLAPALASGVVPPPSTIDPGGPSPHLVASAHPQPIDRSLRALRLRI